MESRILTYSHQTILGPKAASLRMPYSRCLMVKWRVELGWNKIIHTCHEEPTGLWNWSLEMIRVMGIGKLRRESLIPGREVSQLVWRRQLIGSNPSGDSLLKSKDSPWMQFQGESSISQGKLGRKVIMKGNVVDPLVTIDRRGTANLITQDKSYKGGRFRSPCAL